MKRMSPSVILSSVALFFSLCGAGLAASRYLITSVSQIKPNVRAELRGNTGPQGQAGPQGPQGPQGATGPQGPAGPASTINLDGDYSVMTGANLCPTATAQPGFSCAPTADVIAQCHTGDHVVSGGFGGTDEVVTTDAPIATSDGRGWEVAAHLDPAASDGYVSARVVCASS